MHEMWLPVMDGSKSSPIRGTWIEMSKRWILWLGRSVVPHTGDVDRNFLPKNHAPQASVVPHTGDVDRNEYPVFVDVEDKRSSPIRGTWIEISWDRDFEVVPASSPIRGTWIEIVGSLRNAD